MASKLARQKERLAKQQEQVIRAERREEARLATLQVESFIHRGPLPPPEQLERYEQIVPGGAGRIFGWVETQTGHRQNLETMKVAGDLKNQRLGQVLAFILAMTTIAGGIALAWKGESLSGLGAIVTSVTGLVTVFVVGRGRMLKQLREKKEALLSRRD